MDITKLYQAVEAEKDRILEAERHIWNHPETGFREWKTHAFMKEQFQQLGYCVTEVGNIPGFYVDVETGRPGPRLAIFAEMDGLLIPAHPESDPETGAVHACAHNCQCAAMVGIAAGLAADGALDALSGSIRLIVVPAEELIETDFRRQLQHDGVIRYMGGKQEFMARGILDGVDLAMMVHTSSAPGLQCPNGSNGCIVKFAEFIGKGAHAGAAPFAGNNALYAANCALNAANALRETFRDEEHVRFHPIISAGGDSVNAIPDKVQVDSYIRGATMESISRENRKINRAFAAGAAALGCGIRLRDEHGYAPRLNDKGMQALFAQASADFFPPEKISVMNGWSGGCSDLGDVCCVMPAVHPNIEGCTGAAHSSEFYISDPYTACVVSAKIQLGVTALLLENGSKNASDILQKAGNYPTIPEYLTAIDQNCFQGSGITYRDDGTVELKFSN